MATLVLLASSVGIGMGTASSLDRLSDRGEAASSVRGAVEGARDRLANQACVGILDEFRDASGQSLRTKLDALSLTPAAYLDHLVFYDASVEGHCRASKVLAMTVPGSRAVFVCGDRFVKARRQDPRYAEVVLIHEALHSLGLGENPPSSAAITARVLARCGR